ncbi:MAG: hypothetical protein KDK53_17655, partial [Maritimibacter sp.]|nr:hypothetical protein [Maritimibacter sp.]
MATPTSKTAAAVADTPETGATSGGTEPAAQAPAVPAKAAREAAPTPGVKPDVAKAAADREALRARARAALAQEKAMEEEIARAQATERAGQFPQVTADLIRQTFENG